MGTVIMPRTTITLTKDDVDNLIEFFELAFLPMVRQDEDVDNLRYLFAMGDVYRKLEAARRRLDAKDPRNGKTAWR